MTIFSLSLSLSLSIYLSISLSLSLSLCAEHCGKEEKCSFPAALIIAEWEERSCIPLLLSLSLSSLHKNEGEHWVSVLKMYDKRQFIFSRDITFHVACPSFLPEQFS
jgi:hypothetical protein